MASREQQDPQQVQERDVNTAVKPTNQDDAWHMARRSVINAASATTSEKYAEVPRAVQSIPWKKKMNGNKSLASKA